MCLRFLKAEENLGAHKKVALFFFSISAIVEAVVPLLDLKTNLKVNKDKFVVFTPSGHTKDAWH